MSRAALSISTALAGSLACAPHAGPVAERPPPEVIAGDPEPAVAVAPPGEPVPTSTTWTALTVAPGCTVQIADAPAALGPPLKWQECTDGSAGCREVSTRAGADLFAASVAVEGLAHGDRVTLAVFEFLPGSKARYVLAPRDGLPFFAVEGPREEQCSLGTVGLSDDGAAVEVSFDHADGYASRAYLRGPLGEDAAWTRVAAVLPRREFPDFIAESVFSAGGRVVVEQNGGPLRWFDDQAKRWVEVPGSRDGWECCARGHGDVVSFLIESIPERAMVARLGERARSLHRNAVDGTSPVAIDGTRAVWVLGRGRDRNNEYKRVELWAAEFTPELTLENARMIATLPRNSMATPTLGGGVAAVRLQEPAEGLAVVRLDGPDLRVLRTPKGSIVERLLWVAADEVAVQIGSGGRHVAPSSVRRVAIASLPSMPSTGE